MIFTIALRELRSMFLSPLAWTIIAVLQFIHTWVFLGFLNQYLEYYLPRTQNAAAQHGVTETVVTYAYSDNTFLLLVVIPLITMRVISEERRNKSLTLLFSAPLSMTQIVLGKYLGIMLFLVILLLSISLLPLSLMFFGGLEIQLFASILLGSLLAMSAFAAVGLYMSSLTEQPSIAAISTFGVLLLLILVHLFAQIDQEASELTKYISLSNHLSALFQGVFNTSDIFYFLLIIVFFVVLSIRRLDSDRLKN